LGTIIKYYHLITIFHTNQVFYEIEGLGSDLLKGFNLLKKIGAVLDIQKETINYNGKEENYFMMKIVL